MSNVALLGTGHLGTAIGQRLLQQGVGLHVWNRTEDHSGELIQNGASTVHHLH